MWQNWLFGSDLRHCLFWGLRFNYQSTHLKNSFDTQCKDGECRNVHIWWAAAMGAEKWCLGCIEGDVWREWWGIESEEARGRQRGTEITEEGRTTGEYLVLEKVLHRASLKGMSWVSRIEPDSSVSDQLAVYRLDTLLVALCCQIF